VLLGGQPGSIYNIGSGEEKTNLEITQIILDRFGLSNQQIEYVEDRLGHDRRYSIDFGKISRDLNYGPSVRFEQGMRQTIDWYVENFESWVRPLIAK
jgi:dTDP-glucose 4,6-dehydratase